MRTGGTNLVLDPVRVAEILPEHLPDEHLSIAVFGPGEGEAIVVRLPDGSVGVVDGCREPKEGNLEGVGDPVRELLTRFETESTAKNQAFRLSFVCLTHPHDDHYAGLGRLLVNYENRVDNFWTVGHATPQYEKALPAWLDMIRAREPSAPDTCKVKGLERVLHRFEQARRNFPAGFKLLSQDKLLMSRSSKGQVLTIRGCGPADSDAHNATQELLAILSAGPKDGKISRQHDPNLTSGALLIRWGDAAVLLAGDLLRGKPGSSGWELLHKHIDCKVQVVNVAHHASKEAHHDDLWTIMAPALAIVTPFQLGCKHHPPQSDQIKLLAQTSVVAITSPPAWKDGDKLPRGSESLTPRKFNAKNDVLASIAGKGATDERRNAVAVSLDATGKIIRFVLAGNADTYHAPGEAKSPAPPV